MSGETSGRQLDNNNVVNNTDEEERYNAKYYDDETIDEMK